MDYRIDPFPSEKDLERLWYEAWGNTLPASTMEVLARSLGHVGAYQGDEIIGFVNIAWDGGIHAFILDTCVHPEFRRRGIATRLVREAIALSRDRGARWLHVDFKPHLESFYRRCGFQPTTAGLIAL